MAQHRLFPQNDGQKTGKNIFQLEEFFLGWIKGINFQQLQLEHTQFFAGLFCQGHNIQARLPLKQDIPLNVVMQICLENAKISRPAGHFNNHGHSFQLNTLALQPLKAAPAGLPAEGLPSISMTAWLYNTGFRTHSESESRLRRDSPKKKKKKGAPRPRVGNTNYPRKKFQFLEPQKKRKRAAGGASGNRGGRSSSGRLSDAVGRHLNRLSVGGPFMAQCWRIETLKSGKRPPQA
ncbi:MAG: hypothetical protein IPG32_17310 [Saprospirales bacterium]|nr:hypothetical protein [Saprospirales bacterium]